MESLFTPQEWETTQIRYRQALERCPARRKEIEQLLSSLEEEERQALCFVVGSMPLSDLISVDLSVIAGGVRHALWTRRTLPYGGSIPAGLFRNYVLFYRVNNEAIEPHRKAFCDELFPRIQGKTMEEAALEVNYWCYEKATYQATDDRTASPMTVLRRGYGRCGEESTLTVEAMRSVGIPARQCYAPRWAHCDDNHAWVEVWTGDGWHYLGACEPEPVLDKGWFTSAASRAVLVHSRAFSPMVPGEEMVEQTPVYTTVNNISVYAPACRLRVLVTLGGKPLSGARVRFELLNYAELYPLHTAVTGEDGTVELLAGKGSLYLHVSHNGKYCNRLVDLRKESAVTVSMDEAVFAGNGVEEFEMVPPEERIPETAAVSSELEALHEKRLLHCETLRREREADWYTEETARAELQGRGGEEFVRALVCSRGNFPEVAAFLHDSRFSDEEKSQLFSTLREKDFVDSTAAVLAEYLECSKEYRQKVSPALYAEGVLSPRIHNEMILPVRRKIQRFFAEKGISFSHACEVALYLKQHIRLLDGFDYSDVMADPSAVLRCGVCSSLSLKLTFVAVCRALGFPARLNPATGVPEYGEGDRFLPLPTEKALTVDAGEAGSGETGLLTLVNKSGREMNYFEQYSVARLLDGVYQSLTLWGDVLKDRQTLSVEAGDYRILTSARQIDGSVLVRAYYTRVEAGGETVLPIALRPDRILEKLRFASLPLPGLESMGEKTQSLWSGRAFLLAFVEPGKEPTEHLLNELIALRDRYEQRKIPVAFVLFDKKAAENPRLQQAINVLPETLLFFCGDRGELHFLRRALHVGDERLPLAIAVDQSGRGLFAFANYHVGAAGTLLDILKAVSNKEKEK